MKINKKHLKNRITAAGLTLALTLGSFCSPSYAYHKVSDGTYQLLDGTAITGVHARGIDVSHWRGSIDWEQVAKDDVSFAMLGTRYSGNVDPYFDEFATGAHEAGIAVGAYIYSYAMDVAGAEAEADFVLDLIKDYPISYPIAYDLEDNSQAGLSPQYLAEMVNAFCAKIEAAGYYPMLYANDYWLANRIDMSMVNYDVWVARYEVKHAFRDPVMWQATSSGTIKGINGSVDINFQYKDFSPQIASNLWRTIGDSTYYYQNYQMQKNAWIHDGTGWFYLNATGQPNTGWFAQNGNHYFLDETSGKMAEGWKLLANQWYYFGSSGAMQSGWINDGTAWYFLSAKGPMTTGWLSEGQTWYYLRESGSMVVGWRQIGGNWYYFDGSGAMKTGWVGSDSAWYYLNPENGTMFANTEITVDQVLYQVDASGVCRAVIPEATAPDAPGTETIIAENPETSPSQPMEDGIVAIVPPLP